MYNIPTKAIIGYLTQEGRLSKVHKEVKIQTNLIIQKYKGSGIINNYIFRVFRMERIEAWKITLKTS